MKFFSFFCKYRPESFYNSVNVKYLKQGLCGAYMEKYATFIIFGGTGDLTKRKLLPALSQLVRNGTLKKNSSIIGVGRSLYTDETYRKMILDSVSDKFKGILSELKIQYYKTNPSNEGSLNNLKEKIEKIEPNRNSQRIYYLATTYKIFPAILHNLKQANLHNHPESKIVFEKPFGNDLKSAENLEKEVHEIFPEERIFRIDHYLGKDAIQNLIALRFTNPIIDVLLNKEYVKSIYIYSNEEIGVGNRLGYYDSAGAVKDMIQSHLLQVASLILMERPDSMFSEDIHNKKFEALKNLKVMPAGDHVLGQYEGYGEELKNLNMSESKTETFARLKLRSSAQRWAGTDIFLETGKNLDKKESKIVINFKPISCKFADSFKGLKENKIVIDFHPSEDISLHFNARNPSEPQNLSQVKMNFDSTNYFEKHATDGYKRLLGDILFNDHTLFIRYDELRESWKIIEEFEKLRPEIPLKKYKKGIKAL